MAIHKIICIDDRKDIRNLLEEVFKEDYDILTASTGKEGVELAKEYNPDIAIIDFNLDDMKGTEVLKLLRNINENIKSIIITGDDTLFNEIKKYNPNEIVKKPFNIFKLRELVSEFSKCCEI